MKAEIITKEMKKMIEGTPLALATINTEGKPHVIATAFVKVKDDKIIITNNYMVNTIRNIRKYNNVSLAVWDKNWKGYQINGKAHYYSKGIWLDFVRKIK